jgi:Plasmid pRiA4b ORF-3-like protein.
MSERLYLLKIKLLDIEPEIWRRFVVPSSITLDRLHDVIQIVMGWTDTHIYEFIIGKRRYTEYLECEEDGLACGKYRLGDLIKQKGRTFHYLYDFGDNWEHELLLEDSRYSKHELQTDLFCLEGERACPPEDVGGVPAYYNFCDALRDRKHPEHEKYMRWLGGTYHSERFNVDLTNLELMKYYRWSRDRVQNWVSQEW